MLLPLQGVTNERTLTQGVASLALGEALLGFQPACIIGCTSAIQASLIVFDLHDKARLTKYET